MTRNTPTTADNNDPWEQIEADLFGVDVGKEHTAAERVAEEPVAEEDAPPDTAIAKPLEADDFSDFSDFGAGLIEDEPSPPPRKVSAKPTPAAKPAPVALSAQPDTSAVANLTEFAEPASLPDDEAPTSAVSEKEKEDPYWDALANWNWSEEGGKPKPRHKETSPAATEQPSGETVNDSEAERTETARSSRRRERRRGRREDVLPEEQQAPDSPPEPEPQGVAQDTEQQFGWSEGEPEDVETTANVVDEEATSFDNEGEAETEEGSQSDEGPRRKRRRRRRRRPGDRTSTPIAEESNDADVRALSEEDSQEPMGFDEGDDTEETESEPVEEERPARRDRRGHRGGPRRDRGRSERAPAPKPAPASEFQFSDDEEDDFDEPSFDFSDENEDEEEFEEQPPPRSRRGRPTPSRAAANPRDEDNDEEDGEPDPSISFEDVPTWEEAISYLLNPTLVEGGTAAAPGRGRSPERPERAERSERPPRSYRGSSRGGERSSSAERSTERSQERSEERPAPRQDRPPQQRSQERPPRTSGDRPAPRRRPPAPPSRGDDFESF